MENNRNIQDHVISWYPLVITYGKVLDVCVELSKHNEEYYYPAQHVKVDIEDKPDDFISVTRLLFIHSSFSRIQVLKREAGKCRYMRFISCNSGTIKDYQSTMTKKNFRNVAIVKDEDIATLKFVLSSVPEQITLILYSEKFSHIGKRIKFIQGPLYGICGILRRIQKNKHVHLDCGKLITAQINYVPQSMYEILESTD